ncbi:HAD family hydrolase [Salipaludibacillus sp. CF4.18]|uniref:HAD family hydrolase n=1 Tax=Salipaludibacillus sp. CF4.18 TaxID=3373081 RepID=UPI003EE5203E
MEKLYIFDLDGTLYEGTDHFDYYAERLATSVAEEKRLEYWNDYKKMKNGNHTVQIGKGYDVANDAALTIDPMTLEVVDSHDWDGNKLPAIISLYKNKEVQFDFEKIIAIGDGWWLPFVCAKHYRVKYCYPHYLETKDYMSSEKFNLDKISGLKEGLLKLKQKNKVVLITNSDKDDVERLMENLDLTNIFDEIISSAKKPSLTSEHFKKLQLNNKISYKNMISIGDNFMNEIAPALLLGIKAVYIAEHKAPITHRDLTHIHKIGPWIKQLT